MVKWIHPTFGVHTVFVENKNECVNENYVKLFDAFVDNLSKINGLVVENDAGNQCLFHQDIIIQGFFELVIE